MRETLDIGSETQLFIEETLIENDLVINRMLGNLQDDAQIVILLDSEFRLLVWLRGFGDGVTSVVIVVIVVGYFGV